MTTQSDSAIVPELRIFQFDRGGLQTIKDSVNLYRGDVALPLALLSLPVRNGLSMEVTATYGSNVQNAIRQWNMDAPTGVLGLGISLTVQRIRRNSGNLRPTR